jgi:Domain of unknown function (DUF4907)
MTTKKKYSLIGIAALLIGFAVIFFTRSGHERKLYIHTVTFKNEEGWGYSIMANERVYIKQDYIPAIVGKHSFSSEQDAAKVGDLMVKRISTNQQPTITAKDLSDLGIKY